MRSFADFLFAHQHVPILRTLLEQVIWHRNNTAAHKLFRLAKAEARRKSRPIKIIK